MKSDFADTKKHLIREALDVLVPVLVERFQAEVRLIHARLLCQDTFPCKYYLIRCWAEWPSCLLDAQNEQDFPIWIRYAQKHMLAEGHKLNLLVNLWQMVVRHPDLFYKFRAHFLAQMVNTLSRLRLPANASTENKKMAVDMARVIVEWEVRRMRSVPSINDVTPGRAANEMEEKAKPLLPVDNKIVKKEEQEIGPSKKLNSKRFLFVST